MAMPCAGCSCLDQRAGAGAAGAVYRAGVRFQGVDVAVMLDDWLTRGGLAPNVSIRVR